MHVHDGQFIFTAPKEKNFGSSTRMQFTVIHDGSVYLESFEFGYAYFANPMVPF